MKIAIALELVHSDPTKYKRWLVQPEAGSLFVEVEVDDAEVVLEYNKAAHIVTLEGLYQIQRQLAEHAMRLEDEIMKEND